MGISLRIYATDHISSSSFNWQGTSVLGQSLILGQTLNSHALKLPSSKNRTQKLLFAIRKILKNKWSSFLWSPVPGRILVDNFAHPITFIFEIFNHNWVFAFLWHLQLRLSVELASRRKKTQMDCNMSKRWQTLECCNTVSNTALSSSTNSGFPQFTEKGSMAG